MRIDKAGCRPFRPVGRFSLWVLAGFLATTPAIAQPAPPDSVALIDTIRTMIRTRSVHRHTVDWAVLDTALNRRLDAQTTFDGKLNAFRWVFQQLDDVHSHIVFRGRQVMYSRPMSAERAGELRPLVEMAQRQSDQPRIEALDAHTGWLMVPGYTYSADRARTDSVAQFLSDKICSLRPHPVNWIIDLRLNMGGTMHPMLAALARLLGDGLAGGLVDAEGRTTVRWRVVDGVFLHDSIPGPATVRPVCTLPEVRRVAVIVGPVTMSSGEAVAIAFRGRANTRFFGEPTAGGYSTANHYHRLTDELLLNLSEAVMADRSGRAYPDRLEPEVMIEGPHRFDDLRSDPRILAALQWFGEH